MDVLLRNMMPPQPPNINDTFPTELFHSVFEPLSRQDDGILTLTECTLVCKLWREIAHVYQFSTIAIRRDLNHFRDFCASSPSVASRIKNLRFYGRSVASRKLPLVSAMKPIQVDMFTSTILPLLPSLQSLHFRDVTFDVSSRSANTYAQDAHTGRPPSLRTLEVEQCSGVASALPKLLSSLSAHTLILTNLTGNIADTRSVFLDSRPLYQPQDLVLYRCRNLQAYCPFLNGILSAGELRALGAYCAFDNMPVFACLLTSDKLRSLVSFTFEIDYHHYFDRTSSYLQNVNSTTAESQLEDMNLALSRLARLQYVEIRIQTNGLPKSDKRPLIFARLLKHPLVALRSLSVRLHLSMTPHAWEGYAGDCLDLNSIDALLTNGELGRGTSLCPRSPFLETVTLEVRWRRDCALPDWTLKAPQEFDPPLFPCLHVAGKFKFRPQSYVCGSERGGVYWPEDSRVGE